MSTDDARAEAQRRYQGDWDPYHGEPVDDFGFSDAERRAFMAGAEWAAGRAETTTTEWGVRGYRNTDLTVFFGSEDAAKDEARSHGGAVIRRVVTTNREEPHG